MSLGNYLWRKIKTKILPMTINGHDFTRLLVAFRRMSILSSSEEVAADSSSEIQTSSSKSAVFGSVQVGTKATFSNGVKLLQVSEMFTPTTTGGVHRQRNVEQANVWIGASSEQVLSLILFSESLNSNLDYRHKICRSRSVFFNCSRTTI